MPQDTTPYILIYKDSAITVLSSEEYKQLPDSIKNTGQNIVLYQQSVENYQQANKEFNLTEEKRITKEDVLLFMPLIIVLVLLFRKMIISGKKEAVQQQVYAASNIDTAFRPLHYAGAKLKFTDEELDKICTKYNPYYDRLNFAEKKRFTGRLKEFLRTKDFYIYADKGYKEMPILISASAIQITFGLDEYKLSHFKNIIIHPDAYLMDNPLRVLMGNVQGNSITLSWKHFLEDYQNPSDGKNVGLHEMAHALQVQYIFTKHSRTNDFKEDFEHYDRVDDEVLKEKFESDGLFDKYALNNKNELWATAVELFFERPADLKLDYPELYDSIKLVLNQDPILML
jgi:Mlc titration factor MtfA (ptsG expression regulator)